jgi:deoxyribonuclease-4
MFSAGYDLRTKETVEAFEKEVDNTIGWDTVELFHFNDSKNGLNARVDRHEKIGEGYIGEEGLRAVAQLAAKYNIPLIMETPILKTDTLDDLKKEVDIVGNMYTS